MVGAVVVKKGEIIGEGYHHRAGTPHAEINALRQAGNSAMGADLYVSLEPCCHTGRTGPCTEAIIAAGIKRVVYAMSDPNPRVKGKGASRLRKAGLIVESGLLEQRARELNEKYIKFITTGKPFVTLKIAQTLDGNIATSTGDSRWITGDKARREVHKMRAEHDAIAVGAGTVRTDNPSLTVRAVRGNNPYRIVLSSRIEFPLKQRLFTENEDHKSIIVTSKMSAAKLKNTSVTVWTVPVNKSGLSLKAFLYKAGKEGIGSILLEGGAGLAGSFIKEGLVDKFVFFIAPKIIGQGIGSIGDLGIKRLDKSVMLTETKTRMVDNDIMLTAYPGE